MNREWQHIPISQQKNFEELSASELKKLSEQYPYSSLHQLLHTLKIKDNDELSFKKQVSKTALYVNNLSWLEYILRQPVETTFIIPEAENINTADSLPEEPADETILETEREALVGHETIERNYSLVSGILDREKEIAEQESELKFEPLHTVDYFASQGIKNITETAANDKLGKQLRSFTEWLKIMKRLPAEETVEINETDEKKIQAEAEDSNEAKDVVTEAMAEVLVKQGKTHKATEIYRKLSLQHPEKSPYFAALIEQLKG